MKEGEGTSKRAYMHDTQTKTTCGDSQREGGQGSGWRGVAETVTSLIVSIIKIKLKTFF